MSMTAKKKKKKKSTTKKVEYEEPLNLHIFCWLAVILFRCGFRRKQSQAEESI